MTTIQQALWDEIVLLHWQYTETDENLEKLEKRRKLEERQKEFLCLVQHDRKFYSPVTMNVLTVSMLNMPDFSASKALIGFESISQYANNLYKKPWRIEYRTIKMYSGFYQHEISANLINAERLFIEMGYKPLSNHTLVLDGPICPDQVSNISRDAMMAYVECRIINEIYRGLIKRQLKTSWTSIMYYRETHVGNELSAIEDITNFKRQQYCREKAISNENNYNSLATTETSTPAIYSNCNMSKLHHISSHQLNNGNNSYCSSGIIGMPSMQHSNCSVHNQTTNYYNNGQNSVPPCGHTIPTLLSHSKSLEYYNNPGLTHGRHIYDQYYDGNRPNCECIDGIYQHHNSNNSTTAPAPSTAEGTNHFYNVPGSRRALPYSLSNNMVNNITSNGSNNITRPVELSCSIYSLNTGHNYCHKPQSLYEYNNHVDYGLTTNNLNQHCTDCGNPSRTMPFARCSNITENSYAVDQQHQQLSTYGYQNGRPLNYVDSNLMTELNERQNYSNNCCSDRKTLSMLPESIAHLYNNHDIAIHGKQSKSYQTYVDSTYRKFGSTDENKYSSGGGATNIGRRLDDKRYNTEKYHRNSEILGEYMMDNDDPITNDSNSSRTSRESDFNSYEELDYVANSSPSKNQDGVGSYESWHSVYKQLEKKDNTDDIIDDQLDIDQSLCNLILQVTSSKTTTTPTPMTLKTVMNGGVNICSSTDQSLNTNRIHENCKSNSSMLHDGGQNVHYNSSNQSKLQSKNLSDIKSHKNQATLQQNHVHSNGKLKTNERSFNTKQLTKESKKSNSCTTKIKDKKTNASTIAVTIAAPLSQSQINTRSCPIDKSMKTTLSTVPSLQQQQQQQQPLVPPPPIIVANEWACNFCTFINLNSQRICEICAKSKDFKLDVSTTSTSKKSTVCK